MLQRSELRELEHDVHSDGRKESDGQDDGPDKVIVGPFLPSSNLLSTPLVDGERVEHDADGDESEEDTGGATGGVAKVDETYGEGTKKDGKVEPVEERSLVGKKHLGLHPCGDGDPLIGDGVRSGGNFGGVDAGNRRRALGGGAGRAAAEQTLQCAQGTALLCPAESSGNRERAVLMQPVYGKER